MDERLLSAVSLVLFLFVGLLEWRTALALPTNDENVQADQETKNKLVPKIVKAHELLVVAEGDSVVMSCNVENADGWALIWFDPYNKMLCLDDEKTPDVASVLRGNFRCHKENHSLEVLSVSEKQNSTGVYSCVVNDDTKTKHAVQLKVSVEIGHVQKIVEVGGTINLSCKVHGSPKTKVQWSRKKSSGSSSTEVIGTTAETTLQNVTVSDSGDYTCSASDGGSEASKVVSINVVNGLSAEHDVVFVHPESHNATICCIYGKSKSGSQNPLRWQKNGNDLQMSSRYDINLHGKYKYCLTIRDVKDKDLGEYMCKTEKSNGAVEKAVIKLTGAPQTPELVEVIADQVNSTSKIPVLKWKINTFAPLKSYELHVRRQEDVDWKLYTARQSVISADKEEMIEQKFDHLPSGQYATKLTVWNKYGSSELQSLDMPLVVDVRETTPVDDDGHGAAGGNHASVGLLIATILTTLLLCR